MKRIVAAIFVFMLVFIFAGCGKESYEVPVDGMYHEDTGVLLLFGMTEDEVDREIAQYGKEDQSVMEELRQIYYHLGELYVTFDKNGELIHMDMKSDEWKMTANIGVGSTLNDVRKAYGNPDEKYTDPANEDVNMWRYVDNGVDRMLSFETNGDTIFEASMVDLSKVS